MKAITTNAMATNFHTCCHSYIVHIWGPFISNDHYVYFKASLICENKSHEPAKEKQVCSSLMFLEEQRLVSFSLLFFRTFSCNLIRKRSFTQQNSIGLMLTKRIRDKRKGINNSSILYKQDIHLFVLIL